MNISFPLIEIIIICILGFLCAVKTFLFFGIADNKSFLSWFHFSIHEIYNSPGRRIQTAKKNQNRFTRVITALLFLVLAIYLLNK